MSVVRVLGHYGVSASSTPTPGAAETWRRIQVAPGVELHLRDDLPKPKRGELKQIAERLERALRREH